MRSDNAPVAIIGMACRVAGAETLAELWRLMVGGERRFAPVDPDRWPGFESADGRFPEAALLADSGDFDARYFGIAPRTAVWMDPQQRMLLELSVHALENAGLVPEAHKGLPVAVLIGAFQSEYRDRLVAAGCSDRAAFAGTMSAFLANRLSYHFDWTGPSLVIDSACSSGLAALQLAVRGLQAGDYPMALVGAANVTGAGFYPRAAAGAGALSPTGDSVPFSAGRDGYVRGEGGACVVLKPLDKAQEAGDSIHAVIRDVGVSHTGRGGGLTATDQGAIAALLRASAAGAGISVRDVGYVEAHGTGTAAGDLAEYAAVAEVLDGDRNDGSPTDKVWIGSMKGNIGHLEAAAGLLGLVKVALMVRRGVIPGLPGLDSPDPRFSAPEIGISRESRAWPRGERPRLAVANSFGLGGTLGTVIVEEPAGTAPPVPLPSAACLLPLSAQSGAGLRQLARWLLDEIEVAPDADIADIAWTLQRCRTPAGARRVIAAGDLDDLRQALSDETGDAEVAATIGPIAEWLAGGDIDWSVADPVSNRGRRIHLPGTPFERRRYWFDDVLRR